jgi:gamma-glutamylcyclotransferase (GGCT)/AIG2-like uncharacterized protein YtfP
MDSDSRYHAVFVYGTLLDPKIQQELFNTTIQPAQKATIHGWKLYHHEEYPFVSPHPGSSVNGSLIRLNDHQLAIADQWEEVPHVYRRELLEVQTDDGKNVMAWVYVKRKF